MKRLWNQFVPITLFMLFTGCYTHFATLDQTPPVDTVTWVVDSATGDSTRVIRRTDTIQANNQQNCLWERDLMGYPRLRCYDSFYSRNWLSYNNSPWWYRNDPFFYDYDRCPRYYYYDPSCGCCEYSGVWDYRSNRYHDVPLGGSSSSSNGDPVVPSGSSYRSRVRGVPQAGTASVPQQGGSSSLPASSGGAVLAPAPASVRERSAVPAPGTATSGPIGPASPVKSADVAPSPAGSRGAVSAPPPTNGDNRSSQPQPQRRNPRSW